MTDESLLTLISGSDAMKLLADAGRDNELAESVNATIPAPVPVSVQALAAAAPLTLAAIGSGQNPLSEMEVIAARIRAGDAAGIGQWAMTLLMLGKMSQAEHDAVMVLVAAAAATDSVGHEQVSRVLNAIRPVVDGSPRATPIIW